MESKSFNEEGGLLRKTVTDSMPVYSKGKYFNVSASNLQYIFTFIAYMIHSVFLLYTK